MISGIFYLACVLGIAYYADSKGRSPIVWGLVAVLTTPLLALIILAFLKNLKDEQNLQQVLSQQEQINDRISVNEINNNRRFENIEKDVKKLENKENAELGNAAPIALADTAENAVLQTEAARTAGKCPYCESEVPAGSKFCGNCGAKL